MTESEAVSLLVIATAAVASVLLADALRRLHLPIVVVEIAMGIVVGPQVLHLVEPSSLVSLAARVGAICLFFSIGYEIRPSRLRGHTLVLGATGWLVSLGVGAVIALAARLVGVTGALLPLALALSTTAVGILLPILRDSGLLHAKLGPHVVAAGASAQFGTLGLVALLFGRDLVRSAIGVAGFLAFAASVAIVARRFRPARLVTLLSESRFSSGQLPVRASVLGAAVFVFLASRLGLDALLAALVTGGLVRMVAPPHVTSSFRSQIDAVGFGVFIPMFFIVTGARFDLGAFFASPNVPLLALAAIGGFLVVRGLPAFLYASLLRRRERIALACLTATHLPLVFVITSAATAAGVMNPRVATALACAAVASVFAFPVLGVSVAHGGLARSRLQPSLGEAPLPALSPAVFAGVQIPSSDRRGSNE